MKKAINENFNGVEIYKFQLPQGVNATSTEHIAINYGKINYWDEETETETETKAKETETETETEAQTTKTDKKTETDRERQIQTDTDTKK